MACAVRLTRTLAQGITAFCSVTWPQPSSPWHPHPPWACCCSTKALSGMKAPLCPLAQAPFSSWDRQPWLHTGWQLVWDPRQPPACNVGDLDSIPGWEDPLEKVMATHSSILAWEIPWTEEPGRLQSTGLQRVNTTEWLTLTLFKTVPPEPRALSPQSFTDQLLQPLILILPARKWLETVEQVPIIHTPLPSCIPNHSWKHTKSVFLPLPHNPKCSYIRSIYMCILTAQ